MEGTNSRGIWGTPASDVEAIAEELVIDDEDCRVRAWRAHQLQQLGLSPLSAHAFESLVDWHDVAALVERGCSAGLAVEILR